MADFQRKDPKSPRQVGVREFRGNMSGFLAFLITSHGEVIAELRPPSVLERPRRRPGALRGKLQVAPDFNELPADLLAGIEGDGV